MSALTRKEFQSVLAVSFVVSLRLLGIFLLLPIFSTYVRDYPQATLPLVGIAFGIYPLVQSLLQVPYGMASDRFGRRNLLILGLSLFTIGSILCAMSDSIVGLILARAVQGSGAVGSVAMAALGDNTRDEVRTQAFTITGITIGAAFVLGLIGGPFIASRFGFGSLFYILAALGFVALSVTWICIPSSKTTASTSVALGIKEFLTNKAVIHIHIAALVCSFTLNLFFFVYPLSWSMFGLDNTSLWKIYIVILLPSLLFVFPYIRRAEKKGKLSPAPYIGFGGMLIGFVVYIIGGIGKEALYVAGALFFFGYTFYQSILPAFITQRTPKEGRGAAIGFYNLSGFFGASLGGFLAGFLYNLNHSYPLILGVAVMIIWPIIGLPKPKQLSFNDQNKSNEESNDK